MTRSVQDSWGLLKAYLEANYPDILEDAYESNAAAVKTYEEKTGLTFPEELVAYFQSFPGEVPYIFPAEDEYDDMASGSISPEASLDAWEMLKDLLQTGEFTDREPSETSPGVVKAWWTLDWIPFADNGAGDFLCVDLGPSDGGSTGQVITHSHESGGHRTIASSLAEYIEQVADGICSGTWQFDADYGFSRP